MPIRWTSRLSLAQEIDRLSGRRRTVYECIRTWDPAIQGPGPSIADIAATTGLKECSVCGRVNELRKLGAIADGPLKVAVETGKSVMTYLAIGYREETPAAPFSFSQTGQGLLFQ